MIFQLKHPFTCLISGPTQSGKTQFTLNLLKNIKKLVEPCPAKIVWCFGAEQEKVNKTIADGVVVVEGLDAGVQEVDGLQPTLLILDDLMQEAGDAKEVGELFTRGSHHRNLSIIMIVQNVFHQGKIMRTASLNAHYMILFKNPRDAGQIRCLANQLFPGRSSFLVDAYKQATTPAHGYLVLDLKQSTPEKYRVLSHILPEQEGYYYLPK